MLSLFLPYLYNGPIDYMQFASLRFRTSFSSFIENTKYVNYPPKRSTSGPGGISARGQVCSADAACKFLIQSVEFTSRTRYRRSSQVCENSSHLRGFASPLSHWPIAYDVVKRLAQYVGLWDFDVSPTLWALGFTASWWACSTEALVYSYQRPVTHEYV